jgi:sortase A
MRIRAPATVPARLLRWLQALLLLGGVAALAYCGWVLLTALLFQASERANLERLILERNGGVRDLARPPLPAPPTAWRQAPGGLVGHMAIPRLGISVMVREGTGEAILRRAAGHIPGTGQPGQPGNVGISAHRDTFFRPLRHIRERDLITLTTPTGEYLYRVVSTRIVPPSAVAVLDADGGEALTLVTCHPFFFVGPAPNRFIVRAERVARAPGRE